MRESEKLPWDLDERNELLQLTLILDELLCERNDAVEEVWRPPCLPETPRTDFQRESAGNRAGHFELVNPLRQYNLRMAEIARKTSELRTFLCHAKLSTQDAETWSRHSQVAQQVRDNPSFPPEEGGHCFVQSGGYRGDFTFDDRFPWQVTRKRLADADVLLEGLRKAVRRILLTLSPEGIRDRLHVCDDRRVVVFDNKKFTVLPSSEGALFYHLREAGGGWVPSCKIAEREDLQEFKVSRVLKSLAMKHRQLRKVVEAKRGGGSRLVLPLPPD